MHEMSIVEALIKQCEKVAKANDAKKISAVHVKIGVLSGVEPHFLESCFDIFKEKTICEGATLHMQIQKIKVTCKDCKATNTLQENYFICPSCKSENLQVDDGEDMMLMRVEME